LGEWIDKVKEWVPKKGIFLDLGCGYGGARNFIESSG